MNKKLELMFQLGFSSALEKNAAGMMQSMSKNKIPFAGDSWADLRNGGKTTTYRVNSKAKVGTTYRATSYGGKDLHVNILIENVTKVPISQVPTIDSCRILRDNPNITEVDKIKFKIIRTE